MTRNAFSWIPSKRRLLAPVVALAVMCASVACGSALSVASAADVAPPPPEHHSNAEFRPVAGGLDGKRITGEIGLTSVVPGQPATFRVQVAPRSTCVGWVVYSNSPAAEQVTFDSISAPAEGELSWTWDTPVDVPTDGGVISLTCGKDAFRIFFGIGAPEIGLLASRQASGS